MKALPKLIGSAVLATAAAMATTTAGAQQAPGVNALFTQGFFSVRICGTQTASGDLSLSSNANVSLAGVGKTGVDVFGNGALADLSAGGSLGGTLSMGGGTSLSIAACFDVLKLVEVLEKQTGVLTEAELAMVNAVTSFDPNDLKDVLVNVAYMTGLEPNRMLDLLERLPDATEEIAGQLTSGDPVDALRTINTLEDLAQDMPVPPVVRDMLSNVDGALAKQLERAVDFLFTMQDEICFQTYPEGLQEVIDELCRPLSDVAFAERLQEAILLIEDLFDVANDTAGVVGDSADTLDEVQDFLENTVNVTIDGIETGVNEIEDFVKGALKSTVDAIQTAVNAIRDVVNDIGDGIGDILDAIDDINPL